MSLRSLGLVVLMCWSPLVGAAKPSRLATSKLGQAVIARSLLSYGKDLSSPMLHRALAQAEPPADQASRRGKLGQYELAHHQWTSSFGDRIIEWWFKPKAGISSFGGRPLPMVSWKEATHLRADEITGAAMGQLESHLEREDRNARAAQYDLDRTRVTMVRHAIEPARYDGPRLNAVLRYEFVPRASAPRAKPLRVEVPLEGPTANLRSLKMALTGQPFMFLHSGQPTIVEP